MAIAENWETVDFLRVRIRIVNRFILFTWKSQHITNRYTQKIQQQKKTLFGCREIVGKRKKEKINTFGSEREMERSRRKCSFEREIRESIGGGGHDRCRGGAHYGFHGDRLGRTERR